MTPKQFAKCLEILNLPIVTSAKVLGVSPRQTQRFYHGDTKIPQPVAKLLALMVKYEVDPEEVEKIK